MSDPYLLLTPFLVLLVFALVRFIGCDVVFDLEEVPPPDPPPAPANLRLQYGDQRVVLTWPPSTGATSYRLKYRDSTAGGYTNGPTVTETTIEQTLNFGMTRYYVVHALKDTTESTASPEVKATGARPLIAVIQTFGVPQSYFDGSLGMQMTIASNPLKLVALGRVRHVKNPPNADVPMARPHVVRIANQVALQPQPDPQPDLATATDVVNGAVTVSPQGGVVAGDFLYETLPSPVDLLPNTTYIVVSEEVARATNSLADEWHDYSQMGVSNPDAVLDRAVYQDASAGPYTLPKNGIGRLYVPVNVLYHPA